MTDEVKDTFTEGASYEASQTDTPRSPKPFSIVARDRVNELIEAIRRYVNTPEMSREYILQARVCAIELSEQIDLISTLLIYTQN